MHSRRHLAQVELAAAAATAAAIAAARRPRADARLRQP